jgi:hypothetical protein
MAAANDEEERDQTEEEMKTKILIFLWWLLVLLGKNPEAWETINSRRDKNNPYIVHQIPCGDDLICESRGGR